MVEFNQNILSYVTKKKKSVQNRKQKIKFLFPSCSTNRTPHKTKNKTLSEYYSKKQLFEINILSFFSVEYAKPEIRVNLSKILYFNLEKNLLKQRYILMQNPKLFLSQNQTKKSTKKKKIENFFFYTLPKTSKIGQKLYAFFLRGFTVVFDQKNKKSRNQ